MSTVEKNVFVVNDATCSGCGFPKALCTCQPVYNRGEETPLGQPTWNFDEKRSPTGNRAEQGAGQFGEEPMSNRTWSFD